MTLSRTEHQRFTAKSGVTVYDSTLVTNDGYDRRSTISVSERTKNGPVYFSWNLDHEATLGEVLCYADKLNTLQRNWIRLGRKVK